MAAIVVHCRQSTYQVYIGRPGPWGNPFKIDLDGDRAEVIRKFEHWLLTSPEATWQRDHLHLLKGKVLGCWCAPKPCHGDVLARLAEEATNG